jgi:hypothetical protein
VQPVTQRDWEATWGEGQQLAAAAAAAKAAAAAWQGRSGCQFSCV